MIVDVINEYDFRRAFEQLRPDNFSYDGLFALYEYLEQQSDDIGKNIELDVIDICCTYSEYENLKDFQNQYSEDYHNIEQIENETIVIPVDDERFIVANF